MVKWPWKRIARGAGGLGVVAVLTFLYVTSQRLDIEGHHQIAEHMRHLRHYDAVLKQELLQIQAGTIGHYDTLAETDRNIAGVIDLITVQLASLDHAAELDQLIAEYRDLHAERGATIDRFASKTATLRDSIRYLPGAVAEFNASAANPWTEDIGLPGQLNTLLTDILVYSASGDDGLRRGIETRLRTIEARTGTFPAAPTDRLTALIAHARTVVSEVTDVQRMLRDLVSSESTIVTDKIFSAERRFLETLSQKSFRYQSAMYVLSILLLGYVLYTVVQLARTQRKLLRTKETLEQRVDERTASLARTNEDLENEIAERRAAEEKIKRMAMEDALTGLPNRMKFQSRLADAIHTAERTHRIVGIMLLDLDHFKHVNDTMGHPAGDALLQAVAKRLQVCTRKSDTVARLGGDEFAVIANNAETVDGLTILARRIVHALSQPFDLDGRKILSGTSIGITVYPLDNGDPETLVRNADLALYRAKADGRGTYHLFDEAMNAEIHARRILEEDLRGAVEREELVVHYQPQIDIRTGRVVGAEALLRWPHPERGPIPPGEFIPVAESSRLIIPISQWLMRTVCAQTKAWHDEGFDDLSASINVSPLHFRQGSLPDEVCEVLGETGLPAEWLELEITEGMVMERTDKTIDALHELRDIGVNLAIDDFGTGYSSLGYLKRFPLDRLKIDQSFVRDIATDLNDRAICLAVIRLGHSLNLKVIAEGVEDREQFDFLTEQGCDEVQGYYFSRPLPAEAFSRFLRDFKPRPICAPTPARALGIGPSDDQSAVA